MEPEEDLFSTGGRKSNPGSSKLASIFAQEPDYSSGNASLSYKGAKQPPKGGAVPSMAPAAAAAAAAAPQNAPLFQCMVTLLRYDASRVGSIVGSRACVLMRHPQGGVVFLCYDAADPTKRDVILQVTGEFAFMPQAPAYGFFYDESKNYWCVQLATADALQDLARAIGLAKAAAALAAGSVSVVTQDLLINASEPRAISAGDAVKLQFKLHAFTPPTLGALLSTVGSEDKPKQMKLGAGKEIAGLEQGLVGMKKGGRRLLVLPASLGYGSAGNAALSVPANANVVLEVELLKVKFGEKAQAQLMPGTPVAAANASPAKAMPVIALGPADGDATPDAAAGEQQQPADPRRNSLLSRMANLGGFAMPNMNPGHVQHVQLHHTPSTPAASPSAAAAANAHHPQPNGETNDEPHPASANQQQQQHAATHGGPLVQQPALNHANSHGYQPGHPQDSHMQQQPQQLHPGHQQHQMHSQQQQSYGQQQQQQPYMYQQQQPQQQQQQQSAHLHPYGSGQPNQPGGLGYTPYGQQQQQQTPSSQYGPGGPGGIGGVGVGGGHLYTVEAKLDAIQSQLSRCLGNGPQQGYDPTPTLSGQQVIKALTALIGERDEAKEKMEKNGALVTELQAKITSLHERHESFLGESSKLADTRFASFADELKIKNATIADMQDQARKAQHDLAAKANALQEVELKAQRLQLELDLAKTEAKERRDLEKQCALLQVQLEEAQRSHLSAGETVKASMAGDLAAARQEVEQWKQEAAQEKKAREADGQAAGEATDRVKKSLEQMEARATEAEKARDTLQSELSAARSALGQKEQDLTQLRFQLDHSTKEGDGRSAELVQEMQRQEAEWKGRVEGLEQQVTSLQTALEQAEVNLRERLTTLQAEHSAALAQSAEEAEARGREEAAAQGKQRLEEVMLKAKAKIEHLSGELEAAQQEKAEVDAQLVAAQEEKDQVIEQSKGVIAKIRTQVQDQQQRHEDALAAAHAATEQAVADAAAAASSSSSAPGSDGVDWRVKVKTTSQRLFQTLARSLADAEEETFTRGDIKNLLMKDIKSVTVEMLQDDAAEEGATTEQAAAAPADPAEEEAAPAVEEKSTPVVEEVPAAAEPEPEPVAEEQAPAVVPEVVAVPEEAAAAAPELPAEAEEVVTRSAASSVSEAFAPAPAAASEPEGASASSGKPLTAAQKKKNKKAAAAAAKKKGAAVEEKAETIEEEQPKKAEVEAEPTKEAESVPEPAAAEVVAEADAPVAPTEVAASAAAVSEPIAEESKRDSETETSLAAAASSAPVTASLEEAEEEVQGRGRTNATVSASTESASKITDPFAEEEAPASAVEEAKPAAAASVAAAKPKAKSLFGDDDDDDDDLLFKPEPVAAPKPKVDAGKRSLFDDDD